MKHKSLKRTRSADPPKKKSPRFTQQGQNTLRLTYLEAYIPVAVVEHLKQKVDKNFSVQKLPLSQHEEETVVMFIDVSSFTTLTETMTMYGPGGLEKLVDNLNHLFSMMLRRIRKEGGDVLKFAGDAIEVYWPRNSYSSSLVESVRNALRVALNIQKEVSKSFSNISFEPFSQDEEENSGVEKKSLDGQSKINTQLPQELRVKLGIGIGKLTIVHLGGSKDTLQRECVEFIPIGKGIVDAHSCERSAERGEVIISGAVYNISKGLGFSTDLVAGNAETPFFIITGYEEIKKNHSSKELRGTVVPVVDDDNRRPIVGSERRTSSRQKTLTILKNRYYLEDFLDGYLPSTVMPYIKDENQFWLPEFRRITTIFFKINLDLSVLEAITEGRPEETQWLQDSFKIIQSTVFRYEGSINKMFFDKGSWNVLVVFGLSPFAHDDDPLRGVLCALAVVGLLASHLVDINQGSEEASRCCAGITTGLAFCGVLGSTKAARETSLVKPKTSKGSKVQSGLGIDQLQMIKREQKEYSVLGDCINLASRLMDFAFIKEEALFFDETTAVSIGEAIESLPFGSEPIAVKGKSQLIRVFQIAEKSDTGNAGDVYQRVKKDRMKRMSVVRNISEKRPPTGYRTVNKIPLFGRLTKTQTSRKSMKTKNANKPLPNRKRTSFFSPKRRRRSEMPSSTHPDPVIFQSSTEEGSNVVKNDSQKYRRRRSILNTLRKPKKSLPVEKYITTEETMRETGKKKEPIRRSTLILKQGVLPASTRSKLARNANHEGLQYVLNRLEAVRIGFIDSCYFVRANQKLPDRRGPTNRRKSVLKKAQAALENIPESTGGKKKFNRVRAVCVEGSIGAGKSHAIAQVFYSKPSKESSRVFLVTTSPFERREKFKGFSVWRELFNRFYNKLSSATSRLLTKEILIEQALQLSERIFLISPSVIGWSAQKKLHKPDLKYLYLLNDVFDSNFQVPDNPIEIDTSFVYNEEEIVNRLISQEIKSSIGSDHANVHLMNDRAILETIHLVSGVVVGLAIMSFKHFDSDSGKDMIAIIDDAQLLPTNSWLVCLELLEWWTASNILIVLGLRNVSFFDPNEKRKFFRHSQIPSSTLFTKTEEVTEEIFPYRKSAINIAKEDYVKQKNGKTPFFRNRLKSLEATEFVHLKNLNTFIWSIITHAFELSDNIEPPAGLVNFFIDKTSGNPLYIVDALKQYISMNLIAIQRNKAKVTLEVTEKFTQKLNDNKLPMPLSVESVCGMFLDSLTTIQQVALKVAAMIDGNFNRKMIKDAFPIEDTERRLDEEWDGLVVADVIELVNASTCDRNSVPTSIDNIEDDLIFYCFQAEWVKESIVNRMLYNQRLALKKRLSNLTENEGPIPLST